ncbi:ras association domain-containing protein 8 isoform X2 [Agrilus planipennis]|uniref:Ras association domain-containing protein 8 isoform X2 n=1 Tax=Agrilus planipennis TaxID=224129 RepID=A0A1W4X565_AGRPL|nr:ras association domain-containing protein 8 isoform X2 [Agrilus planipennis]
MELKVWVDGIQRIVCGVTETTTCQNVVYALAHATGKSGRFTLIERWRNNERQLSPHDTPLQVLLKWGEYSNDVQFILHKIETMEKYVTANSPKLAFQLDQYSISTPNTTPEPFVLLNNSGNCFNQKVCFSQEVSMRQSHRFSPTKGKSTDNEITNLPKSKVVLLSSGPPPYRDPPPPNLSACNDIKKYIPQDYNKTQENVNVNSHKLNVKRKLNNTSSSTNVHYKELISLVNNQKEKLASQQNDLEKYNAEILYWENEGREKETQLERLSQEISSMMSITKINSVQALYYIEEESEIVKQQAKTLSSEITLLRSKLANCETELLQRKNKIRLVMEELQSEQKLQSRKSENRQQLEKNLLLEIEKLQKDMEQTKYSTEEYHMTAEALKNQENNNKRFKVAALETIIIERKRQLERLVQEMKEENLRSLSIAPSEEVKYLFEGPNRTGSTRKMIGSPRQLENAVPTNKNPHGVWV